MTGTPMLDRVGSRFAAAVVVVLSVVLTGCTPDNHDVIASAVSAVYDHSAGVTPQQRSAREASDVATLQWAAELDLARARTEKQLRAEYEAARGGAASGEKDFGVDDLDFWEFYTEEVLRVKGLLTSDMADSLSLADVEGYYNENLEQFEQQDVIVVDVVRWQDGRAGESSTLTIDAESVRLLQEQDDELIAAALELEAGQDALVELDGDVFYQLSCTSRTDGGHLPFDDVTQAALSQLATERVSAEIQRRMSAAEEP